MNWRKYLHPHKSAKIEEAGTGETEDVQPHRLATDLGDALVAYWRKGRWWGWDDQFIAWLIDNGHIAEAAYALQIIRKARGNYTREALERLAKLERLIAQQPLTTRMDSRHPPA